MGIRKMISPLEIFQLQFKGYKNAKCKQIDEGVYQCIGYREPTTEEWTHIDFPERFGKLERKEYTNVYCGDYEVTVQEPVQIEGKLMIKITRTIYDYER